MRVCTPEAKTRAEFTNKTRPIPFTRQINGGIFLLPVCGNLSGTHGYYFPLMVLNKLDS